MIENKDKNDNSRLVSNGRARHIIINLRSRLFDYHTFFIDVFLLFDDINPNLTQVNANPRVRAFNANPSLS